MADASDGGRLCHGGMLKGTGLCRVESSSWRRICQQCMAAPLNVPVSRLRLLAQQVGSFSSGRKYYVQWILQQRVLSEAVRAFRLLNGQTLLIFSSEESCSQCEHACTLAGIPLMPASEEYGRLRMCASAKSFCPESCFVDDQRVPATSCV
eukprot:6723177-Prymnesium_polylepis.1